MNHDVQRLEDLLDREIEAARSLTSALAAERAALTGAAPAAVHETAAEKIRLFGLLERLESERRSLSHGDPDPARSGPEITERWQTLMALVSGCRTANEVNGHIIHIRQNQIRQLIDIVRGGAPMTYGRQGKTFARALRALARA